MDSRTRTHSAILCILTSVFSAGLYVCLPKLSPYAEELVSDLRMVGIINGAYGFTQMLIRIPLGIFSDKKGNRRILISSGLLLTSLSGFLVAFWPSAATLLILRLCAGATAATWLAYSVLFSSYFPKNKAPKAIGIINVFFAIGQIGAMVSSGFLAEAKGMRSLFITTGGLGVLGFLASFFIHEDRSQQNRGVEIRSLLKLLKDIRLLKVSILAILTQIITFGAVFAFVPILAVRLDATDIQLGLLGTIGMLPGVFMPIVTNSLLLKYFKPRTILIAGFTISGLFTLVVPFAPNILILFLIQFAGGFGRGMIFPLLMGLSIHPFTAEKRATAMGIFQSLYGVGMFIGPVIFGFISEYFELRTAFLFGTAICILGILTAILFNPQAEDT